ncbi:hypothetical protein [Gracilimonas sp.]|uniref:hypothetical protein n=1 Tax=Gracilimonas sp. TaxID=1974203 RepID=UPI003D10D110
MKKNIIFIMLFSFLLAACTQRTYIRKNQSHFDYPNSNVTPIGSSKVLGTSKTGLSMKPPTITSTIEAQAYQDALNKVSGADMLINIDYNWKVTVIPVYVLTLYTGKLTVEGYPVTMEVGEQELN